ncbi:hypothetical protein EK0264_07445 [Epidermidibacterium keratini]|uniref:Uncharacterized protein n=1 Tax=Epidermidibacterium keratini TaxID=1891644 RepID=A0A7L4YLH1_9ACTN|nr:hypothetical protein [Epidermidibacterium keratini]QHC00125.1 hypothetical protein EK0264_07445 [Epidermidibacterium keratini]
MNTDELIRTLDVADNAATIHGTSGPTALLERIVQDRGGDAPSDHRRRRTRYQKSAIGVAATIGIGAFVIPLLSPSDPAFADWTATAEAVSGADLTVADEACREAIPSDNGLQMSSIPLVASERRGNYIDLLYYQPNPESSVSCVSKLPPGTDAVEEVNWGVGGQSGPAATAPPGAITQGAIAQFALAEGTVSVTDGAVGPDVVAVTLHASGLEIEASIKDGRYLAWWPGEVLTEQNPGAGVSAAGGGAEGMEPLAPSISYDIELADGTVLTDVAPALPQ